MTRLDKASEFLDKAEQLLSWSETALEEIREHGQHARIVPIKRLFFSILGYIGSAHDALAAAARMAKLKDWESSLIELRKNDPLLNYFWAARNVDIHDTLIKWNPVQSEIYFKIVDAKKANREALRYPLVQPHFRIWCALYNVPTLEQVTPKFIQGRLPTQERLEKAGVELTGVFHSLELVPFSSTVEKAKKHFDLPKTHMGEEVKPLVHYAVGAVLTFYRMKLAELLPLIGRDGAITPDPISTTEKNRNYGQRP